MQVVVYHWLLNFIGSWVWLCLSLNLFLTSTCSQSRHGIQWCCLGFSTPGWRCLRAQSHQAIHTVSKLFEVLNKIHQASRVHHTITILKHGSCYGEQYSDNLTIETPDTAFQPAYLCHHWLSVLGAVHLGPTANPNDNPNYHAFPQTTAIRPVVLRQRQDQDQCKRIQRNSFCQHLSDHVKTKSRLRQSQQRDSCPKQSGIDGGRWGSDGEER